MRSGRELLAKTLPELGIVRAMMAGRAYAAVAYLFARSRIERAQAITGPLTEN